MHDHVAAGGLDLVGFLLLGLVGSTAHCAAMCSPFVLFVSARYAGPARSAVAAQSWYAAGRLTMYAVLGAVAGAVGAGFQLAGSFVGLQRAAAGIAGAVLVASAIAGLFSTTWQLGAHTGWFGAITRRLQARVPGHPYAIGLVLGLLPCGLLYTAVVGAVARGSLVAGAVALAVFGAGTVPALFGVAFARAVLFNRRLAIDRLSQVFVLLMGLWYLWRGLV